MHRSRHCVQTQQADWEENRCRDSVGLHKIFKGKASVVCQLVGSYFITVLADAQIMQVENGRTKGRNECSIPVVICRACRYRPLAVTQRISVRTGSIKGFSGMFHSLKG